MFAVAPRRAGLGVATAMLLAAATASGEEGDACVSSYEQGQQLRRHGNPVRARAELRLCFSACPTLLADDCARWLREVEPEIARVALRVLDGRGVPLDGARVLVDGAAVPEGDAPLELDPGRHTVRAEAPGTVPIVRAIDVQAGTTVTVELRLVAPPPPPPQRPQQPQERGEDGAAPRVGYVVGGAGVLALAVAAGLGIVGHVKRAQLVSDQCRPNCDKRDVESIRTQWVTGGVVAGAGAAALGVGALLILLPRRADNAAPRPIVAVDPGARAGWLGVSGAF